MSASGVLAGVAIDRPTSSSSAPPWWAHLIAGAIALGAGVALQLHDPTSPVAGGLIISGAALLGVGGGVAASQ